MKFAVISDIHGNAPALRLVLADAAAHSVDGYLLAGDYCISAPWASEVVSILRNLPNARIIRGNDEAHLDVAPGDDGQFEVSRWCMSTLTPEDKAWLDALPEELTFACEGVNIRMAHSSQVFVGKSLHEKFRTSVLPGFFPDGPASREELQADFCRLWEKDSFREYIHALPRGVYVFGHNHIQSWADFDGRILVNPGSCGLPLDCGEFGAVYSLLTIENGRVSVEERRIPYDAEELIMQAKSTGQYAAARVWTEIIFSEWRTVREKVYQFLHHCERYANEIGDARRPFAKSTWEAAYAEWTAHAREWHPELFV
ncbi:MAG: metallophosphoesterase family protein [Clostridia bacterium]|nr:metallophosphoesterase family protein [Clostridia bacterium]